MTHIPTKCINLPAQVAFFRSVATAIAFRKNVEFVEAAYFLHPADVKVPEGPGFSAEIERLQNRFMNTYLDKLFLEGPAAAARYEEKKRRDRATAKQAISNTFDQAVRANEQITHEMKCSIRVLTAIKVGSKVTVSVLGANTGGAAPLVTGLAQSVVLGFVEDSDIADAVVVDMGKEAMDQMLRDNAAKKLLKDKDAQRTLKAAEKRVAQQASLLEMRMRSVFAKASSPKRAQAVWSKKSTKWAAELQRSQAAQKAAANSAAKSAKQLAWAKHLGKGASVAFVALDVLEGIEEFVHVWQTTS